MTRDDRFACSYDAENRLITVVPRSPVEGSFAVENRYSHKNLRVRKIVRRYTEDAWPDYATHDFTYDGGNIVCYVLESGTIAAQYVYAPYGNI